MSEMNELFYTNPYLREFDATVVACTEGKKGFEVVLDNTAFYPEGGGQPADLGTLGEAKVSDVRRQNGVIIHFTDKALEVGATVHGVLDWERRYDNMQNHTGEHVLSGVINHAFGYENVGFHMHDDAITIDMDGPMTDDDVKAMEKAANDMIKADIAVDISFPSAEERAAMGFRSKKELTGKVRIVNIPTADCCACCGTHVKSTQEVGIIKVLSASKHRGGTRIEFVCGDRALRDFTKKHDEVIKASRLLSVKPDEVAAAVEKTLQTLVARDERIAQMNQRYFEMKTAMLPADQTILTLFEEGLTPFELKLFATQVAESKKAQVTAVFAPATAADGTVVYNYVIAWDDARLREASKTLNQRLNGRGGGKDMVQGSFKADRAEIETAIAEVFGAFIQ
ncbi:MAG: alanyl-tRNA editing protein [Burkholderiaceae bacterium]|nr:alanyl-tRNA editing protein [Burkholderiaceae bacterium]